MIRIKISLFLILLTAFISPKEVSAQFGQLGINYNSEEALESYTLFQNHTETFLIDNCGRIVNQWDNVGGAHIQNHSKLLPNGNILYMRDNFIIESDFNNNIQKVTEVTEFDLVLEYEIELLPNGNYLCVARRIESSFNGQLGTFNACFSNDNGDYSFFYLRGFDTDNPELRPSWNDAVVEIEPQTGNIVWEWNIFDHVIQERDLTRANYGSVKDNPQLLNMDALLNPPDWEFCETFMINGMDYNPDFDQIALSVRKMSEVVIIDHSTTTEEARGSTGGRFGKGGDILYRWGNPENYNRGGEEDRILYFQHDPQWIKHGEHKGKMIIFNNGLDFVREQSTVEIIELPVDESGNYILNEGEAYGPKNTSMTYDSFNSDFDEFSPYTCGSTVLPNGNIFITIGDDFRLLELNPAGELLWDYRFNYRNTSFAGLGASNVFRSEKYPIDHPAFEGMNLEPGSTLEFPPSPYICDLYSNLDDTEKINYDLEIIRTNDELLLNNKVGKSFNYRVFDISGQLVSYSRTDLAMHKISTLNYSEGFYIVQLTTDDGRFLNTMKLFVE